MRQQHLSALAASGLILVFLASCSATNAVSEPVSGTYTGTQTIELGAPPEDATHIRLDLTCRSAGVLVVAGSDEVTCPDPDNGTTVVNSSSPLSPGQDSFEVTAVDPDVKYELTAVYENGASVK